ncbi:MAG: DCC1-like thiol-disulfide oxidoreductase family protein [Flavobacteriaceae bacterium]|nr:DCC1-like thiol-disulfide oxidoreductase family protein [Flavobacteriaceae bacterium]
MKNLINNAIIFFDGKCNLCNSSVNFIIKNDSNAYFMFSPLTSNFSRDFFIDKKVDFQNSNTVILFENNMFYTKSDALLKIFKNLKKPLNYIYYLKFIPKTIRGFVYELIANNRYSWFGKQTICMIPSQENLSRFL